MNDAYPSTFDVGADITPLGIVKNARDRFSGHATRSQYIWEANGTYGCCAIGSIAVAVGMDAVSWHELSATVNGRLRHDPSPLEDYHPWIMHIEEEMRDATREAIRLLNKKAAELFPEFDLYYSGAFEAVNERSPEDEHEANVLAVFDAVIADLTPPPHRDPIRRRRMPADGRRTLVRA